MTKHGPPFPGPKRRKRKKEEEEEEEEGEEEGKERTGRERNISSDVGLPEQKDSNPYNSEGVGVYTLESTCTGKKD